MYIKIYFNDKPVFLCDELNEELKEILHHPDAVFVDDKTQNDTCKKKIVRRMYVG